MPRVKTEYFLGLDLGQSADPSALAIAEKTTQEYGPREREDYRYAPPLLPPPRYDVRHLARWPLGTPYPQIVRDVSRILTQGPLCLAQKTLVIDRTGVGAPVCDLFSDAGLSHIQVSIHGGGKVTQEGLHYSVPKRDLVSTVQVLLQGGTLKIAEALPEAQTLVKELLNFKVKIDPLTAHDSYAAWRENIHDDLVLAVALACWYGEHQGLPAQEVEVVGLW